MKNKNQKFECVLLVSLIVTLVIALVLFRNYEDIVKMIVITFTNCLVYLVTKHYETMEKDERVKEDENLKQNQLENKE